MLRTHFEGLKQFFCTGILLSVLTTCLYAPAFSVVTFDGSSVAKGRTDTLGPDVYIIDADMGTQTGSNLFHSFRQFNIGTNEVALFTDTGATGPISNIIGRITGGSRSSIDGTIGSTIYGANLYLMNPYGFMFGPNASISVPGSFHVTTADYLKMADGAKFYADLGKTSVLSTEAVTAFGFLTSTPASISVEGSKLWAEPLLVLSLVGGDIEIKGDPSNPTESGRAEINAPGGQVNLVALASPGEVLINQAGETPRVDVSSFGTFGNISLSGSSVVDVSDFQNPEIGAGTIIIRGGNLQMTTATLYAQTSGAVPASLVGVDIALTGNMLMERGSVDSTPTAPHDR
jgi:filamentous hemagglutinin family protein